MTTYQNAINRVSLPSEFFDITNALVLTCPTPQMPYAQMAITAMGKSLEVPGDIENPGRDAMAGHGSPYAKLEDMQLKLNDSPIFSDTVVPKVDFSKRFGATMRFNRPSLAATTHTLASRIIGPNVAITTTPIGVTGEQTALTLVRVGGPYDSTNSCVAPYAIESFDESMSVHSLVDIAGLSMKFDFHRTLEGIVIGLMDLGTAVYPGVATADTDFVSVTSYTMDAATLRKVEAKADYANIPQFSDGFRVAMLNPMQIEQLKGDDEWQKQAAYFKDYNTLFPNYIKSIGNTHVFKNNLLTETANASSVYVCKGHYFGPQTLLIGMGRPPTVRPASDDNYGETPKILWIGDMAFGLADSRFVYTVRSATKV